MGLPSFFRKKGCADDVCFLWELCFGNLWDYVDTPCDGFLDSLTVYGTLKCKKGASSCYSSSILDQQYFLQR